MLTRPKISQPLREAIDEIESWLDGFPRRLPDIFKVAGYAGTGKTTLISQLISRLGEKDVYCAALSGKAAHVMRSKGIKNASTIHSLIYRLEAQPIEKIQQLQRQIERASNIPANGDALRVLKAKLRELSRPSFRLNKDSKLREARLLILDEVSMVGEALAKDVLSFGRPTLVVGDPGQLPPVDGVDAGYFDAIDPDITLTEPQRQEAGSPIVEFATDIRLGRSCRKYGKGVYGIKYEKLSRDELYAWFEKADQVICGLNRNRREYNVGMLRKAGFEGTYPIGSGERLICLKNDNERGLVNGMPVALTDVRDEGHQKYFHARLLVTDRNGKFAEDRGEVRIYKGHFEAAIDGNDGRTGADAGYRQRERLVELDWGYCITAHKAQGSEWNSVLVVDDGWGLGRMGGEELHRRWLYTAVTRARKRVAVVRKGR